MALGNLSSRDCQNQTRLPVGQQAQGSLAACLGAGRSSWLGRAALCAYRCKLDLQCSWVAGQGRAGQGRAGQGRACCGLCVRGVPFNTLPPVQYRLCQGTSMLKRPLK